MHLKSSKLLQPIKFAGCLISLEDNVHNKCSKSWSYLSIFVKTYFMNKKNGTMVSQIMLICCQEAISFFTKFTDKTLWRIKNSTCFKSVFHLLSISLSSKLFGITCVHIFWNKQIIQEWNNYLISWACTLYLGKNCTVQNHLNEMKIQLLQDLCH